MRAAWNLFKGSNFYRSMRFLWKGGTATRRGAFRLWTEQSGVRMKPGMRGAGVRAKRAQMARNLRGANRSKMSRGAKQYFGGMAQDLRQTTGARAKQYFWPGAGNKAWAGTTFKKNMGMSARQAKMARLRRTGGAAVGIWAGTNALRRGNQIGPF